MKRFTTVSLLLAGLIATCTGRNIEVGNNQLQGSSSEVSSETKESMHRIELACYEKTGSSQTFEAIGASFAFVPVCFFMKIDGVDFMNDLDRLNTNASTRHEFFPKYCPQIRNVLPCLDPPMNELSKCLDDDDTLILHGTYNAMPEALDLICENDGEILFQEGASLEVCMKNYYNYSEECGDLVSNSTNIMAVSKYGEAQCGELSQVRDCMQSKFNECNGPRLMDVFDVFWSAVLKNSPCRNVILRTNEIDDDKARQQAD
ncbi:27 kDa hemolymph protein-like [Ochlerotatus camptorhynchus]|uniref:27 kDa hemolymph protein-like n=1 Tax=Ochlerotatus camptorhynchus TaxID=644619 RepID=UPI0031DE23F9